MLESEVKFVTPSYALGVSHGLCSVVDQFANDTINPLHLPALTPEVDAPENFLLPDELDQFNNTRLGRRRRESEYVIKPEKIDKGGVERQVVTMVSYLLGTKDYINKQ